MSNKSGVSNQIISLPRGGGALSGIGEKFAPDLHTRTGNFTLPIAVPPGRNGFRPQLNLTCWTGSGNGHGGNRLTPMAYCVTPAFTAGHSRAPTCDLGHRL